MRYTVYRDKSIYRIRAGQVPVDQEQIVKIFKALSKENRLKILKTINDKAECTGNPEDIGLLDLQETPICCVDEIVDKFDMAQSSVSQHLKELHNAGLLQRRKKAQWVYYSVDHKVLEQLVEYLNQFGPRV